MTVTYNPDEFLTTTWRALKDYLATAENVAGNVILHEDMYELQLGFPPVTELVKKVPFKTTLIHFEVDDLENQRLGFGDGVVDGRYFEGLGTVEEWEANCHILTLDVGVWASVESGGSTARLEATEALTRLLHGPGARADCLAATQGVEILSFSGGRFLTDEINDVAVFRMVDAELRLRVFSRLKRVPIPFIELIQPQSDLVIDETIVLDPVP